MAWSHIPDTAVLIWITVAFPFTVWDNGYMHLRPNTLPGEKWHSPIWTPYTGYSAVDHMYSREAYDANDGFAPAQALMNLIETLLYVAYFIIVLRKAQSNGTGGALTWYTRSKVVFGRDGAVAVWIGLMAGTMTASKTLLCFLTEAFSGWHYTGHLTLIQQMSGGWGFMVCLYFSASIYMTWHFSNEVLRGLVTAAASDASRPRKKAS